MSAALPDLHARFERAFALHQGGQLAQAQTLYREILETQPRHFDALHLLAMIAIQTGNLRTAVGLVDKAIEVDATCAAGHFTKGVALQQLGRLDAAVASYDGAIAIDPGHAEAHCNRAVALTELRRLDAALASCDRAIELKASYAKAHYNRGVVLCELGRLDAALASYQQAVVLTPDYVAAYFNRGNVLKKLGQMDAALADYDRVIAIKADHSDAHCNRGNLLQELRRFDAAVESYHRAIAVRPADAVIHCNLGNTLKQLKQWNAAVAAFDQSLALDPNFAEACFNRGDTLREMGQYPAAIDAFKRSVALKPDLKGAHGLLLHMKMHLCDWQDLEAGIADLVQRIERGQAASPPFGTQALLDSAGLQRKAAEAWVGNERALGSLLPPLPRHVRRDKIRIGWFSGDFREHAVSILAVELFEALDRTRFELIALSYGPDTQDPLRKRMQRCFDRFVDVDRMSDQQIALCARTLEIDIAVDLGGYTSGGRPGIFAQRAAPLQVSYLGYAGTAGAPYIDYLIADRRVVPEASQPHYTEKIIYLPHSYLPHGRQRAIASREFTRAELGLPEAAFVFCCFNRSYKIGPAVFASWMRILERAPGSVLWLSASNEVAVANLRREAVRRNVDAGRLIFAQHVPAQPDHLSRLRVADLFIDTLPFNAHTTAVDALWAGVPVLTRAGATFAGRVAASLLDAIGLPELIASTEQHYEELAVGLGMDPERLRAIRAKLALKRLSSPLFDAPLYARHLQTACERILARYQAGAAPDHVYIEPG